MSFILQPVTSNEIDSDALYLDEITLTSEQDAVLRYGQVEVPLPPGADVERTTWGISVNKPNAAKQQGQLLEKARNEMGELTYILAGERTDGNGHFPPFAALLAKRAIRSASCSLCAFLCTCTAKCCGRE